MGAAQWNSTSFNLKLRAFSMVSAAGPFCRGESGSVSIVSRTFSKVTFSSGESRLPWMTLGPGPWPMMFDRVTLRITPTGGSLSLSVFRCSSLRLITLKWSGSPSPHQNQSKRLHSMVQLEMTTFSTTPPSKTMKKMPRLELVMTQLLIVTLRMALKLQSQNLMALDDDDSRQLVTV